MSKRRRRARGPACPTVELTRRLERTLRQGHPWVWRDAVELAGAEVGSIVDLVDRKENFVARGFVDAGPIGFRVLSLRAQDWIDADFVGQRVRDALSLRDAVIDDETDGFRLLHGEGDRLPGVVCDIYGAYAVLRFDGEGPARALRAWVVDALRNTLSERGVDNLLLRSGRRGTSVLEELWGAAPPGRIVMREHGMKLLVDIVHGQKTGMFLDHRPSRYQVRKWARGRSVLNLFGYTGGFSIAAGMGGASSRVVTVDQAGAALALAADSWALNGIDEGVIHECVRADVFAYLDQVKAAGGRFGLVVSDPPSFAPRESAVGAALASYQKIHEACLEVLEAGGIFFAASCSSHVRRDAFEQTVLEAARVKRRSLQLLGRFGAGPDHPRLPAFVEGDYLKTFAVMA
ncbi:MAG: class I SAM-dependent rRNA methyltransferase [Myxococcota bacterium]